MATIHRAEIRPTKLELIADWLPGRPWAPEGGDLEAVGAYRFDDPGGEVGVETHLLRTGDGTLLQVPLTYRGAPLDDAEPWLAGTMEHSVLGSRWVYDGCGDPVYVSTLAAVVIGGGAQAEEYVDVDGRQERRTPTVAVAGTGHSAGGAPVVTRTTDLSVSSGDASTVVRAGGWELTVLRRVEPATVAGDELALTGTWAGQDLPTRLVTARRL